jgi:hypothetical protein
VGDARVLRMVSHMFQHAGLKTVVDGAGGEAKSFAEGFFHID